MDVAVITGASMGLGAEFARQLAARGENLLLVARSGDRLEALAAELAAAHGVQCRALAVDLVRPGAGARVEEFLTEHDLQPVWLINNAGVGGAGPFAQMTPEALQAALMVNVVALTDLTRRLLPRMRARTSARILNVASRAAFQAGPWFGVYAASKAYVLSLSEALHEELSTTGVRVTCLCPGPTATEFNANNAIVARPGQKARTAREVVAMGLKGSDRGRAVVVCQGGWMIFAQRLLPRWVVRRAAGAIIRAGKIMDAR